MEALDYNVWDIQGISKSLKDDEPITDEILKQNGFSKDSNYSDRLVIFKNDRNYRCDILWLNINLKIVKDLRELNRKLFKNID